MIISKTSVYVPTNENASINEVSKRIVYAASQTLNSYNYYFGAKLFATLSKTSPEETFEICRLLLKRITVGQLNTPLFAMWENRGNGHSLNTLLGQFAAYVFQINGNDLYDENYMFLLYLDMQNNAKFKEITLASEEEARALYDSSLKVVLHKNDREDLCYAAHYFYEQFSWIPTPSARTQTMLMLDAPFEVMQLSIPDVLRYFAARHDSAQWILPANVIYSQMTWQDRVTALTFMDKFSTEKLCEAMGKNRQAWDRFVDHAKFLRQRQFLQKFPRVIGCILASRRSALDKIKNGRVYDVVGNMIADDEITVINGSLVYRTFASKVESALAEENIPAFFLLMDKKPNYLLQNLVSVAGRIPSMYVEGFKVAVNESIKKANHDVLFSIAQINPEATTRIIDVKGTTVVNSVSYPKAMMTDVVALAKKEIRSRYGIAGRITVSPEVENMVVPFLAKNQELTRGSRISFSDERYLHFFMKWIEKKGRVDLDHAWVIIDDSGNQSSVSFWNQSNPYIKQSGDITSAPAPHGSSEYSVIDIERIPSDIKYIVPGVNVFSGGKFSDMDTAYAGFMFNEDKKFSINQDHVRYDLNKDSTFNIPFVVDAKNREIIIVDYNDVDGGNIAYGSRSILPVIQASLELQKMTVGEFAKLLSRSGDAKDEDSVDLHFHEGNLQDLAKLIQ